MKVWWLIALLLPLSLLGQGSGAMRDLYTRAHLSEEASMDLLRLTEANKSSTDPVKVAYHGAALMVQASHAKGAGKKVALFKEGKEILEQALGQVPENVEILFLRMTIQENAPNILNYNNEIQRDKQMILGGFSQLKDGGLKKIIRHHAAESKLYSNEEKALLEG